MRTDVSVWASGRRGVGAAIAAAAISLGIAACGSSAPTGTEADPASLAPSSSVVYVSAVVRPEGTLRQFATDDLGSFSHTKQPLGQLLQSLAGSGPLGGVNFQHEVEPWVGHGAGLFATSASAVAGAAESIEGALGGGISPEALLQAAASGLLKRSGTHAALVLDTRDLEGARSFVNKLAQRQGAHQAHYRGIAYNVDSQGQADAIVGKFAVFGDEAGVKEAIETHLGGASLKSSGGPYARLAAREPAQALAGVYLNPTSGRGSESATASAASILDALPGEPRQARISIVPQHGSFAIDADLLAASSEAESKAAKAATEAAGMLANLPGNSWLGAAVGESGAHVSRDLPLLGAVVSLASKSLLANFGGPALNGLVEKLSSHGAALQEIFTGSGPAAVFAAGSGLLSIQAGLIVQCSSAAAARGAVGKLGALLANAGATVSHVSVPGAESAITLRVSGLPVSLDIGAGAGKLVIGLGPESVQGALSPTSAMSSSSLYGTASSALGGAKPVVIFDVPMALALLEGLGLTEDPSVAPVLGKLRALGTLAGSVQPLGGSVLRLHLVAQLQG